MGGKARRFTKVALLASLLVGASLIAGCGGDNGKMFTIADIGWTENTAISGLTKVLLEEEVGYEKVTIKTSDLDSVFEGVAGGDLDAFQDVWLPNQQNLLGSVEDNVELLGPWYQGETRQGIGVPSYMDTVSLDQLNESEADQILGIEPSSVVMEIVLDDVIPAYGLGRKLIEASTEGMLAEIERRTNDRENFAFVAWAPHWMNQRYDFRYLEDPRDAFGELNNPAEVSMIVHEDLRYDDPVAYAFMRAMRLDEEKLNNLEDIINEAGDPLVGARRWVEDNRDVVQPWIDAAEAAREG